MGRTIPSFRNATVLEEKWKLFRKYLRNKNEKKIFTFDRNTDIGQIQIGDRFYVCVSSDDIPHEDTQCGKRLIKHFGINSLPARELK